MILVEKPAVDAETWTALLSNVRLAEQWSQVLKAAQAGRQQLLDEFDRDLRPRIKEELYKRYMAFLAMLFNGKCAYCEAKLAKTQKGDVEHFRPKGRVVDDNFKPVRINHPKKGEIDHPGYFWLAYEWKNLLPACIDCNRYRNHGPILSEKVGAGKADRFPVTGFRACEPDEETKECALLINPSEVDPSEHFEFNSNGMIRPKTESGKKTLEIFGLNDRETLQEERAKAYEDAAAIFDKYLIAISARNAETAAKLKRRLNEMLDGKEEYAAMQRMAINDDIAVWKANGVLITLK